MIHNLLIKLHLINTPIGSLYNKIIRYRQNKYSEKLLINKQKSLKQYGPEALCLLFNIFKRNNIYIWFEYGTLLGAYREKGFIPYDDDIDLSMYYDDYTPELQRELFNEGFSIKRMFYKIYDMNPSLRRLSEITLIYKDVQIDVFMNFRVDEYRLYSFCKELIFPEKNIYAIKYTKVHNSYFQIIEFMGIEFYIPSNAKECLEIIYGKNFMTPIKNWTDTRDKDISDQEEPPYEKEYCEMIGAW